jgi:glycosyltransferase involved in cell wall biosynthesis
MPLFSVIIPTRNREHFLREAVDSVLSQSMDNLELLVVNDGERLVSVFDDPRVRIIDNAKRGHVPARNAGRNVARGGHIAFLDDDDVWIERNHLSRALHLLSTGADFTFADGVMQFPDNIQARSFAQDATAQSLEQDNTILVSAICYRHRLHDALGAFDENLPYYWDWDWYLRVARSGARLAHDPNASVSIRIHEANMSGGSNSEERAKNLDALAKKHAIGPLILKNHIEFAS